MWKLEDLSKDWWKIGEVYALAEFFDNGWFNILNF